MPACRRRKLCPSSIRTPTPDSVLHTLSPSAVGWHGVAVVWALFDYWQSWCDSQHAWMAGYRGTRGVLLAWSRIVNWCEEYMLGTGNNESMETPVPAPPTGPVG